MTDIKFSALPVSDGSSYDATDRYHVSLNGGTVQLKPMEGAINDQTAAYTLALTDAGKEVRMTSSSALALTIPPSSSVAFTAGDVVYFSQGGAGTITAAAGSGVTLQSPNGAATTAEYDMRAVKYLGSDVWRVI